MKFDIWNHEERNIVCVSKAQHELMVSSENHLLLEVKGIYTVNNVQIYPWYTLVSLKEFPGKTFNSVIFDEIGTVIEDVEESF